MRGSSCPRCGKVRRSMRRTEGGQSPHRADASRRLWRAHPRISRILAFHLGRGMSARHIEHGFLMAYGLELENILKLPYEALKQPSQPSRLQIRVFDRERLQ